MKRICVALVVCLLMTACSRKDPIPALKSSMNAVATSVAVAVPAVAALSESGAIPEPAATRIMRYLHETSSACLDGLVIVEGADTARVKIAKVSLRLSAVADVAITDDSAKARAIVAAVRVTLAALIVQLQAAGRDIPDTAVLSVADRQQIATAADALRASMAASGAYLEAAK